MRQRFAIVFAGLLAVTIAFCSLLIWDQHRNAIQGADSAIRSEERVVLASQLREALTDAARSARDGESPAEAIARFRHLAPAALAGQPDEVARDVHERFDAYADALARDARSTGFESADGAYDRVADSVSSLIDGEQTRTHRVADKLRSDQQRSLRVALMFLAGWIVLVVFAAYEAIAIITRPLSSLVRFLDEIDVEDDLPSSIPSFDSQVPEVTHVARSFAQMLGRLRGYRALNVGRLLIEKRRAEIIAASITDGVFLLRGEEVLYANPAAERMLGVPLGRGFSVASRADLPAAQAVRTAITRTMPVEFTLENGDRKYFYLIQAYPIENSVIEEVEHSVATPLDGVLDRFQADTIVVAQDVTLVRESEEAKRHFLGTLSHEVRTPVTSLTMATRLLKRNLDEIPNVTQRALVKTCIDDVERLRGLVEDLVTVSRFETLTQRMDVRAVDLGKLVRHSVQAFQSDAKERGIELTCKVLTTGGQTAQIPVDATKISWAVSNLMTNALRHTPRNGRVEAELEAGAESIEFRVRDTGPGIERKRQGRIFEKFNPHYDLRVARTGSAGMGLAIAREIVVAHGGKIWVSSEPGQGALFAFTLPFGKVAGLRQQSGSQLESLKGAIRGTPSSSG